MEVWIPLVTAIVVVILTFIFNRVNTNHNKKLELEKKKFEKRLEIRDARIKEAREIIDKQCLVNDNCYGILSDLIAVIRSNNIEEIKNVLDKAQKNLAEMKRLNTEANITGIVYLDDKALEEMVKAFMKEGSKLFNESDTVFNAVRNRDTANIEKVTEKLRSSYHSTENSAILVKIRIDELAQSIK